MPATTPATPAASPVLLAVTDLSAVPARTVSAPRSPHDPRARADVACCAPLAQAPLGADDAIDLARRLKALADPARLRLLSIIAASPDLEACVCDLIEPVGLSQPTVSHHLKVLVDAGLLTREKRGVWAHYGLVPAALDALADIIAPERLGAGVSR